MSELIIIGYDDPETAHKAYDEVLSLERGFVVTLNGLAVVSVDDNGKTHVETPSKIVGVSAASGALWGAVLGVIFLMPGIGLLMGGALGALMGKLSQSGVDNDFKSRVEGMLQPGKAALVLMASKLTEDKFIAAMKPLGGTVLQTSLATEDEKELAEELGETTSA